MSTPDLAGQVEEDARRLAESLKLAIDNGVGPAQLLPRLVLVFREAGLFSGNLSDLPQLPLLPKGR